MNQLLFFLFFKEIFNKNKIYDVIYLNNPTFLMSENIESLIFLS